MALLFVRKNQKIVNNEVKPPSPYQMTCSLARN